MIIDLCIIDSDTAPNLFSSQANIWISLTSVGGTIIIVNVFVVILSGTCDDGDSGTLWNMGVTKSG